MDLYLFHFTFIFFDSPLTATLRQSHFSGRCQCACCRRLLERPRLHQLLWDAAIWHVSHFHLPNWKARLTHSCLLLTCHCRKHTYVQEQDALLCLIHLRSIWTYTHMCTHTHTHTHAHTTSYFHAHTNTHMSSMDTHNVCAQSSGAHHMHVCTCACHMIHSL